MADYNLRDTSLDPAGTDSATIGGVTFAQVDGEGSGTGNYNPFLATSSDPSNATSATSGVAAGFNTDSDTQNIANNEYGEYEIDKSKTEAVKLSSLAVTTDENGNEFYEIRLDLNEDNNESLITLEQFRIYLSEDGTIDTYDELTDDTLTEKVYDLDDLDLNPDTVEDNTILLSEVSTGSGTDDYRVLISADLFEAYLEANDLTPDEVYFYLYTEMGRTGNVNDETAGFDEWSKEDAGIISGMKFEDADADGIRDLGEGAFPEAVTVYIDADNDGVLDDNERSTLTDENGEFAFYGVTAGTYILREDLTAEQEAAGIYPTNGLVDAYGSYWQVTVSGNGETSFVEIGNFYPRPSIVLTKSTEDNEVFKDGEVITYTYLVENDGNIDLTGVSLTDYGYDSVGAGDDTMPVFTGGDDDNDGVLDMGEVWTYTLDVIVTQDQIDAGDDLVNVAVVTTDQGVTDEDDETVTVNQIYEMTIDKTVEGTDTAGNNKLDRAGDIIDYQIVVTNSGFVTLTEIEVSDPLLANLTLVNNGNGDDVLDVGESWTYTGSYAITQEDLDSRGALEPDNDNDDGALNGAGDRDIDNVATATSKEFGPVTDDEEAPLIYQPLLGIDKVVTSVKNPDGSDDADGTGDEAGDVIHYQITVSNDGNVTLTNVVVSDPLISDSPLGTIPELGVGESVVYTGTYTITQDDLDSRGSTADGGLADGDIDNTATAHSNETGPVDDSARVPLAYTPILEVTKLADITLVDSPDDTVTYTYTMKNAGNVTLTGVTLVDDAFTPAEPGDDFAPTYVSGDLDNDSELDVGETWTFTATVNLTQEQIDAGGEYTNIATGDTEQTGPEKADETIEVLQEPAIRLEKSAGVTDTSGDGILGNLGDTITWSFVAYNEGNVTLTGVTLTDPDLGGVLASGVTLEVGDEGYSFDSKTQVIDQVLLDTYATAGDCDLENIATVAAAQNVEASDDACVDLYYDPRFELMKEVAGTDISGDGVLNEAGDLIDYKIVVTNTGNISLTNYKIEDALIENAGGSLSGPTGDGGTIGVLDVGETWIFTGSYAITQSDLDNQDGSECEIENVVLVDFDEVAEQEAKVCAELEYEPDISIIKTATIYDATGEEDSDQVAESAGDYIVYSFEIENTGKITLTGVLLSDDLIGLNLDLGELDPGEVLTVESGRIELTQEDFDTLATVGDCDIENTATVIAAEGVSDDSTACVDLEYDPKVDLRKMITSAGPYDSAGDVISYRIEAENIGNITLTGVVLSDALNGSPVPLAELVFDAASDADGDGELDVNETWAWTYDYTVTQADLDTQDGSDCEIENVASVITAEGASDEAVVCAELEYTPDIDLRKTITSAGPYDSAGDVISYRIEAENIGNITLTGVVLSDALNGSPVPLADLVFDAASDTDGDGELDVNETWAWTYDYTVTQADLDTQDGSECEIENVASVITAEGASDEAVICAELEYTPEFELMKEVIGTDVSGDGLLNKAGDLIDYKIVVTNTGNISLTGYTITDALIENAGGSLSGPTGDGGTIGVLDVGESWTFTGSYAITQTDLDTQDGSDCEIENVVLVDFDQTPEQEAKACSELEYEPAFKIVKTSKTFDVSGVEDTKLDEVGDYIVYEVTVENTGNITLTNVDLDDSLLNTVVAEDLVLAPGESRTFNTGLVYILKQEDFDNGGNTADNCILNVVTGTSDQTDDVVVIGEVCDRLVITPLVDIEKYVSVDGGTTFSDADSPTGPEVNLVGDAMADFRVVVRNDGNITLTDVTITDTTLSNGGSVEVDLSGVTWMLDSDNDGLFDDGTWTMGDTLEVGDAIEGVYSLALEEGQHINEATVTTTEGAEDSDLAHYFGLVNDGPGVRTPGGWGNSWKLKSYWNFVDGDEKGSGDTFPDGEITYQVLDKNCDGEEDNNLVDGLLLGDWNKNGLTDEGETTLFVYYDEGNKEGRDTILEILNGATGMSRKNKADDLARHTVASWLNYLAGNGVGPDTDELESAHDYIDAAIVWLSENVGVRDGCVLNLTLGNKVRARDDAWRDEGSALMSALDEYNNDGTIDGRIYAHDADDAAFQTAIETYTADSFIF
ncbi:DUF7507 domain-containing protein [Litorisediminicola beolgyonensis]|uniref:DUF7507 domain-containing protein n=1 Tax=Litorisediminicola beolgyonensis TaxID=1173614 RepID=A0ABW3ZMI6_9RHOB